MADFRSFYGPTVKAFEELDENGGAALGADLARLVRRWDRNDGGSIAIPATYLESHPHPPAMRRGSVLLYRRGGGDTGEPTIVSPARSG